MANGVLLTYSIFVFTLCIDYGDGRSKTKDKDGLDKDIDVFKRMAEKIEREMEEFYEDYPEEAIKQNDIEKMLQHENIKNILADKGGTRDLFEEEPTTQKFVFTKSVTNAIAATFKPYVIQSTPNYVTYRTNALSKSSPKWPKFEDILLEIGKKYDWENDRWLKVKRKATTPKKVLKDNSVSFLNNHRFSYKGVKLNRKSRRNIVIAVTAVR